MCAEKPLSPKIPYLCRHCRFPLGIAENTENGVMLVTFAGRFSFVTSLCPRCGNECKFSRPNNWERFVAVNSCNAAVVV